jgi:hypothetical protein
MIINKILRAPMIRGTPNHKVNIGGDNTTEYPTLSMQVTWFGWLSYQGSREQVDTLESPTFVKLLFIYWMTWRALLMVEALVRDFLTAMYHLCQRIIMK